MHSAGLPCPIGPLVAQRNPAAFDRGIFRTRVEAQRLAEPRRAVCVAAALSYAGGHNHAAGS